MTDTIERPDASETIKKDTGFSLRISEDKLRAYIFPKGDMNSNITLDEIKALLEKEGIKQGIVVDSLITEYLEAESIDEKPWKIAEGKPPEAGRAPQIKYYFEIDSLKIGRLEESGRMDYKDRGKIPQVKKGALIAEKIPGKAGTAGIDIYGKKIMPPNIPEVKFLHGKGAEKSEDGFKIFAKIDGRPEVQNDGRISVLNVLQISGDVGFETGHIDFDGAIEVRGSVQEGFRVRGKSLNAQEILKAQIDIAGDIVASGGILGSTIKAGGKITANHIHNSTIQAAGDIDIQKEVYDSKIETNGKFNLERGNILSSSISAKKGITAREIGSMSSPVCTLVVGVDNMLKKEVGNINGRIAQKKEEQRSLQLLIEKLQQEFEKLDNEIEDIPQQEDRARFQQIALKKNMEELVKLNDSSKIAKVKEAIDFLDSKITQIQGSVENLLDEQEQVMETITKHQEAIKNSEKEVENLRDKINELTESSQNEKGIPVVKVSGMLFAGAHINGPHASLDSEEDYQRTIIREIKITEPDSPLDWEMNVSPLR